MYPANAGRRRGRRARRKSADDKLIAHLARDPFLRSNETVIELEFLRDRGHDCPGPLCCADAAGSTFEESLRRWRESVGLGLRTTRSTFKSTVNTIGSLAITLLIGLILILGIVAEFIAVPVLYDQRAGQASGLLILVAMSLLLVLVGSVPVVRFCVTVYRLARSDFD